MSIFASRAARRAWSRLRATTANKAWPWNIDLIEGEQRLIGEDGRDVVLAWNIRRSQNNDDARGAADRL